MNWVKVRNFCCEFGFICRMVCLYDIVNLLFYEVKIVG